MGNLPAALLDTTTTYLVMARFSQANNATSLTVETFATQGEADAYVKLLTERSDYTLRYGAYTVNATVYVAHALRTVEVRHERDGQVTSWPKE